MVCLTLMLSCRVQEKRISEKEHVLQRTGHLSEHNENPPRVGAHPARARSQPQLMEVRQSKGLRKAESTRPKCFEAN